MKYMNENELMEVNGGISIDINKAIDQLYKVFYDFGHDVIYPYIFKPLFRK